MRTGRACETIFTPTIDVQYVPFVIVKLLVLMFSQLQSKDYTNIFSLNSVKIKCVSNEHLILLGESAPVLHQVDTNKVVRISQSLALKCRPSVLPSEAKALELVRARTTIQVPQVYRSFQVDDPLECYGTERLPSHGLH
ncbi:hypothetical protein EMPG_09452 [Blastomyces silverae]|uniref:Uncharacterized protein n=1 Tax=Blastomyces silverae TaxID=2060906 RepID=A0A0H1BMW1_9EURO|nr:hypothetical protein EMPG_09452 [Blastomyces silverae]